MERVQRSLAQSGPLYLWVASLLRDQIEVGQLAPHDAIPSERALSEQYGVSRMTARQAVQTLKLEGYVYRHARRGTFVAEPRLRFSVGSFTHTMAAGDHLPGNRVLRASTLDPDPFIATTLNVSATGKIHLVQRLRSAHGAPIALETIHLSAERFPDLLDYDLAGSLWELFGWHYDVHPAKAEARVVAVSLDPFEAEILEAPLGSAAIVLTRTVLDTAGEVIELARDVYRGDRAEFSVTTAIDEVVVPPSRITGR